MRFTFFVLGLVAVVVSFVGLFSEWERTVIWWMLVFAALFWFAAWRTRPLRHH